MHWDRGVDARKRGVWKKKNHYKHVFPGMSKCERRNPDLGKAKGGSLVFELVVATGPIDCQ